MVLIGWCCLAIAVLVVSLVVHVSTYMGVNPMEAWPGVVFIHIAIFPPLFAALLYARRAGGKKRVLSEVPPWLSVLTGALFVYAMVNFTVFVALTEGEPQEREGKYYLMDRRAVLREIKEPEYHLQQLYVARGFSGHWMLFPSAALMFLVGAAKVSRCPAGEPATTETWLARQGPAPGSVE
jgi:hypothetical protein